MVALRGSPDRMNRPRMDQRSLDQLIDRGGDLMISLSGIRGVLPVGLDPINIVHFTRAFAASTGKRIVIGNDARPTAPIMRHLVLGTLVAAGKEVVDVGLAPTPTVKAAVRLWKADAGIMLSASHNPPQWNAFKFLGKGGFFFDQEQIDRLLAELAAEKSVFVDYKQMGRVDRRDGIEAHVKAVLDVLPPAARKEIRGMKYSVVVDAVGGAGREALPLLLEELGCRVKRLFCEATPKGEFPRPPEPTPAALRKFGALVKASKAAVGFALDPDADRLVLGTRQRGAINEEYTLPLALMGLSKTSPRGVVVVNLSTSNLIDKVAAQRGLQVVRSAVGEANVVGLMRSRRALFGGEGNGGVIDPRLPSFGRDTLSGAALVLAAMARERLRTLDALVDRLPRLYMEKRKSPLAGDVAAALADLKNKFPGARADETDGLRLDFDDGWIHARASNTEPILRIIAQADSPRRLREVLAVSDS